LKSTLQLHALIVLVPALGLALNPSRAPNVAEQVKCVVFAKACLVKWSPQAPAGVVVAWAQSLLRRVQSVQVKAVHRLVSHTQLMFRAESIQVKQCALLVAVLLVLAVETTEICMCMSLLRSTLASHVKMTTLSVTFH
jgi:hypothetical protein